MSHPGNCSGLLAACGGSLDRVRVVEGGGTGRHPPPHAQNSLRSAGSAEESEGHLNRYRGNS